MKSFKEYLEERTAQEVSADILKIDNQNTLNKIDSIISEPLLIEKINKIIKNKQLPPKSEKAIINFFINDSAGLEEKNNFLSALQEGMIKKISAGIGTLKDHIDSKYNDIVKSSLFINFCNTVGDLKDSKSGQGSTGTGAGEVLLAVLTKDGYLPSSKGDVNILKTSFEVKSSNGRLAAFDPADNKYTFSFLDKHDIKYNVKDVSSLEKLIDVLSNEKDSKKVFNFLVDYYESRAKDKFSKNVILKTIKSLPYKNISKTFKKEFQTRLGVALFAAYQKDHGWDGFLMFDKSTNFLETKMAIAYNTSDAEKYLNFSGMGMTNGNQPIYSTVKVGK